MFNTQATTFGTASRAFPPRRAAVVRFTPALRHHANDNRVGLQPHRPASLAAPRLVCRWRLDAATGRLVCSWELDGGEACASEPEPLRRAA